MVRKFATKNRIGTGKIDPDAAGAEKWANSVAEQVATADNVKSVLTKTIPVTYVVCDPENPRKLALKPDQITAIAAKYPLDKSLFEVDGETSADSDWIESYVSGVAKGEQLVGKAVVDFESLVRFAAALKSGDRMLHPIVVRREESTFHLIAGERRLFAHILLSETNISARILEQHCERSEIDRLQWEENTHRVDMILSERIARVKKIADTGKGIKTTVTELSKLLGRSRAESQRYLAILRYPDSILMDAINDGEINDLKVAAALAQLPLQEVEAKLAGKPKAKPKPAIKVNKSLAPQVGQLIQAAAKQLKMRPLIEKSDLSTPEGINEAIATLIAEMETRASG